MQNSSLQKTQADYLRLKRELVQETATRFKTTNQIICQAYYDLLNHHLYDDKFNYVKEQLQFIDIDNITKRPDLVWQQYEVTPRNEQKIIA